MAAITNAIEKFLIGDYSKGKDNLNVVGGFLHDILADATYAPTKIGSGESVTYQVNENFHPYSAMMRATLVAFFVLWGINSLNNRLPYQIQGVVKTVGTASALVPLFHLYGIAINSIRELSKGKPSIVENKDDSRC